MKAECSRKVVQGFVGSSGFFVSYGHSARRGTEFIKDWGNALKLSFTNACTGDSLSDAKGCCRLLAEIHISASLLDNLVLLVTYYYLPVNTMPSLHK